MSADGRIPLVVGVTGHRRLHAPDVPRLEAAVGDLFERVRRTCPGTPLLLITPLAEGADRLVARVALEHGAELVVPLPLEPQAYARDFPEAVAEFEQLLRHERTVRVISLPRPDAADPLDPETAREVQYALAGLYVARHSQILIALWDGVAAAQTGGTAQIVQYRRTGRFHADESIVERLERAPSPVGLPVSPLDPPDTGTIYHVVTPRADRPSPDSPFTGRWLGTDGDPPHRSSALPASLVERLERIEAFNAEAVRLAEREPAAVEESERTLHRSSGELARLRRAFALADVLSLRCQRETYNGLWLLYVLVFLAVICFEIYAHLFPPKDRRVMAFLVAYVAVVGVADLVYLYLRHRRTQSRFQDYRALAEGLRVQFYWRLAGLPDSAADHYLRKQRDELSWIRDALRAWGVGAAPVRGGDAEPLLDRWIQDQRDYFTRATRRDRDRLQRHRSVAAGIILASLGWVVPTVAENLRGIPAGELDWANALQVPLLAVSLVLTWHIAFKGSEMLKDLRARGARAVVGELSAFGLSVLLGLGFMALMWTAPSWVTTRFAMLPAERHPWVVVAFGLVTVAGAMVQSYTQKRAFGEHARQYARMAAIFSRAGDRMAALLHDGKLDRAGRLALELGKEALAEHGDWLILHRERPVELPKGKL